MVKTTYFWDEETDNVLMESDDVGNVTQYTQKPEPYGKVLSQNRNGTKSYYHYDAQGSVRQLTDSTGTVTDTATYTAFGETVAKTGTTVNPWGYKGAVGYYTNPATDDLYVRARTLAPWLGRWLSEDPIEFMAGDENLFRYVQNRSTFFVDPSGLDRHHVVPQQHYSIAQRLCRGRLSFGKHRFTRWYEGVSRSPEFAALFRGSEDFRYGRTPHGYLHNTIGYNELWLRTAGTATNCCDLLVRTYNALIF